MINITKSEFKGPSADPLWIRLFDHIKQIHTVAPETVATLNAHRHTKDFAVQTKNFFYMNGRTGPLYFSYVVWQQFRDGYPDHALCSFESIQIYESQLEYEIARTNVNKN